MSNCIFCSIIAGEIPAKKVYEDDKVVAFHDISPQAPVHILVIPKLHMVSAMDVKPENSVYVAACFTAISHIAKELGLHNGFRVITNSGEDGGQTVFHLHFHILGGTKLGANLL